MQSYFGDDTVNLYSTSLRKVALLVGAGAVAAAGMTGLSAGEPAQASEGGVWDKVAECESGGDWHINTGNGYYGGLQFSQQTWTGFGGSGTADQHSEKEQIRIAQKVLKEQGPGAWLVCGEKAVQTKSSRAAADGGGASDDGDSQDSGKVGPGGNVTIGGGVRSDSLRSFDCPSWPRTRLFSYAAIVVSAVATEWSGYNADNIHYVKLTVRAALPASATHHGTHVTPQRRSRSTVSEPAGARRLASAASGRHPQDTDFRIPPITELSILPFKRAPDTVYW